MILRVDAMMKKWLDMKQGTAFVGRLLAAALLCLFMLSGAALADQKAEDITRGCRYSTNVNEDKLRYMHNNKYGNHWDGGEDGEIHITCPNKRPAQGIMLSFFRDVSAVVVEDDGGNEIARYDRPYATNWIPFDHPVKAFTLKRAGGDVPLRLCNIHVMSEGKLPGWIQDWSTIEGNAELMLIVTHPDDEILWFGGLLPTYAGERHKKVQVVYMVGGNNGMRTAELLDGLWTMGVRLYPDIGTLPDKTGASLRAAAEHWGGDDVAPRRVTRALRRYKPQVVVTQDVKGEYGHYHHIIMSNAVIDAVTRYAMDPEYDPDSAMQYGVHTPQKLYVHLWKENRIKLNWRAPLSAFGGKTGLQVAREAFKKHESQQSGKPYRMADSGMRDCSLFGLYYTGVGPDEKKDDFFEHVLPEPNEV